MKRIEQKEIAIDEVAEINGGIFQCVAMDFKNTTSHVVYVCFAANQFVSI